MERFMPPHQCSSLSPFFKGFSRETKSFNCPGTLNDHVLTTDPLNDLLKSSMLEKAQCNITLQKTSAILQEAAKAGYESCQYQHSSIDRKEIPEISEKRSSDAMWTTGHSRTAIRKGLRVKSGFLLACGLPQTSLQAETYPGDSDLLSCLEEQRQHKDSQSGDNVQGEIKAYFLLLLPCWLCIEVTKSKATLPECPFSAAELNKANSEWQKAAKWSCH